MNEVLTNWWTGLLVMVAIALLAVSFIMQVHEWGIRPLRDVSKVLHRPWFEVVLLIFLAGGLVQHGSTKGTNGVDRGALMGLMRSPAPAVTPTAVDSTGFSIPTNFPTITNLCFWGIEHGDDAVALGIAWPPEMSFTNDCIDIFGSYSLASNGWWRLAQLDVSQIGSNAIIELAYSDLPTNAMHTSAFYRLALQDDSDGDGLTDKVEDWVLGTDPILPDSDNDGLPDGDEIEIETDPKLVDSDGDGICDGDEGGYISKSTNFEWYDTTGWKTTYGYPQSGGLSGYFSAYAMATLSNSPILLGTGLTGAMCFDNGSVYTYSPGTGSYWIFPECVYPLSENHYDMGDVMIAPYWCGSSLLYGDQTSYIRTGIVSSNNCFVAEYHNVKLSWTSDERMTYQVIIPGGTGSVIRISYHSSDIWIDGDGAVVGVQNKRITTTNGCYNLTWDFSERGPILPQTTIEYHLGYGTSPTITDSDSDGLDDGIEVALGTIPTTCDTDGDGLSDGSEISIGTNPNSTDTDGDGLQDGWEVANGLNPLASGGNDGASADPDNDGLNNSQEQYRGTDPWNDDSDDDGLSDGTEVNTHGTSPIKADTDADGLTDSYEIDRGLNPKNCDSDGDGMSDGWETANGLDPQSATGDDGASGDVDLDGLCNFDEFQLGCDPNDVDSDGDGVSDCQEICNGSNPADGSDKGIPSADFPNRGLTSVTYAGVRSSCRQIINQADYFYYSGHGNHRWGMVDDFEPSAVSDYWQRDLNCAIFAGCSVLDINDYNNNFLNSDGVWDPENHSASPGKLWEAKGPNVLLGYNYYAPQDETGAPERIIRSWLNLRLTMGDAEAWMKANDNMNGRNACVIVKGEKYIYFKKSRHKFYSTYEKKEISKEHWND